MRLKLIITMKIGAAFVTGFVAWASYVLMSSMEEYYRAFRNPQNFPSPFAMPFWGDFILNSVVLSFLWFFALGAAYVLWKPVRSFKWKRPRAREAFCQHRTGISVDD